MSGWNWNSVRNQRRKFVLWSWLKPFSAAVPWITVLMLFLLILIMSKKWTSARGLLFSLPEASAADDVTTACSVLVLQTARGPLIFFDDARYVMNDPDSLGRFRDQLHKRVATGDRSVLVLADRSVSSGDLMHFADLVRQSGVTNLLFAVQKGKQGID